MVFLHFIIFIISGFLWTFIYIFLFRWNYPQSIIKPMTRVIKMNWLWTVSIVDLNFYYYILCFMDIVKVTCRWIATIQTQKRWLLWLFIAVSRHTYTHTHETTIELSQNKEGERWLLCSINASSWHCTSNRNKKDHKIRTLLFEL